MLLLPKNSLRKNPLYCESDAINQATEEILQNPDLAAKASTVVQNLTQNESVPTEAKEQVANVVSQATPMVEQTPVPPVEQQPATPPPPSPQTPAPSPQEEPEKTSETKAQEEKQKSAAEAETKAADESRKDEDQRINGELLKTMREILKVLQGPLIVTDNTHKFS